jgi:hypothetical protein
MTWEVLFGEAFEEWFLALSSLEQTDIFTIIEVLESMGPHLPRPYSDTLSGSKKIKNLKELRVQHAGKPYRILYAFDPRRRAILLCGGRKDGSGDKQFYRRMVAIAESEYFTYLAQTLFKK